MVEPCRGGDPTDIGPFRLLARLGTGGFGTVYAARSRRRAGELVAVKVVHPHLADSQEFRSRFAGEIAAIKRVESAFVPMLIDHGCGDEPAWLATELVPGPSLDRVVRLTRPLPEDAVWHLGAGIAEALAAIHAADLVHRDLKPHNVLMTSAGPWIIDFSLVHLAEMPHQSSSHFPMATYKYAAPEQLREGLQAAGIPADVFALGATLLFAATGHPPHDAESQSQLFVRAINAKPNLAGLPRALFGLVENCLLRSPAARPDLADLRAEFARRTGSASDRDAFASVLPPDVAGLLEGFRAELAAIMHTRGSARLGWEATEPDMDATWRGYEPLPLPDLPGESRAMPRTAAEPKTAVITRTRLDTAVIPAVAMPRGGPSPGAGGVGVAPTVPGRAAGGPARWTHHSWIQAPAAVQEDTLVVACLDGTVVNLGANDLMERWTVHLGAAIHAEPLLVARGRGLGRTAYVGAADGGVHAIGIDTVPGGHRPLFQAESAIEGPPVTARDLVYVLSADGCLYLIDPHTDSSGVLFRMSSAAAGAMAATPETIFAAGTDGRVRAIDAVSGKERWQLPTDGLVLGAPVPVAGRLYVAGTDGMLRDVGIEDGHELTAIKVGEGAPVHAAPVHGAGRLYVGGSDGVVTAYDISHRRHRGPAWLWDRRLGDEVAGLAASGGQVYATVGYRLVELNGATGQDRQVSQLDTLIGAPPAIRGRRGYVVGLGGLVTCLELALSGSVANCPLRNLRSRVALSNEMNDSVLSILLFVSADIHSMYHLTFEVCDWYVIRGEWGGSQRGFGE